MNTLLRRRIMMGIGDEPLPYTPVDYIVTDGSCYINTGKVATYPKSCELKILISSNTYCGILGGLTKGSGTDARAFALAKYFTQKAVGFSAFYNYGFTDGAPSVEYSIDNQKPFIIKSSINKGAQSLSVKQENSDTWSSYSKTQDGIGNSTYGLILFSTYENSSYSTPAPSGSRIYYCKIYGDASYTTLIFDGVPCLYNGEYGLWDRVSDSFKGSSASGHYFSGPSNS